MLDKDNSGKLSDMEIKKSLYEIENGEALYDCLRYGDIDGDNLIDFDEFLTCAIDVNIFMSESYLKKAFNHFDSNKNGIIDFDEMAVLLSGETLHASNKKICKVDVDAALKEFDID